MMKTKQFLVVLISIVSVSVVLLVFGENKPDAIQNIVSSTHQQIRSFKDNLIEAEAKTFVADETHLTFLGFTQNPRLYPKDTWSNTSLPAIVTYVSEFHESQAVGLIASVSKVLPNNTILVYDVGVGSYGLRTLANYCNSSRCQIVPFPLGEFPSHVEKEQAHAYRPLVIQHALQNIGSILFLENNHRFSRHTTPDHINHLHNKTAKGSGILAWRLPLKNAVSSRTHKKMFEYFHTDADNFLFVQMVSASALLIVNTESVHREIMLPWVQCSLTQDCIIPIGAQSEGCKFNKKPQYRYSGCHSYDASALNIVLGLKFKLDEGRYTYEGDVEVFDTVALEKADALLKGLEQNITMEGRTVVDLTGMGS